MNKTLLLAGVAACLFAANANAAEWNPYISGKLTYADMQNDAKGTARSGGWSLSSDSNVDDDVYGVNLAYGLFKKVSGGSLRGEVELNYRSDAEKSFTSLDVDQDPVNEKAKVSSNSIMLNIYYDIDTGTKFSPYVGAGVGYARLKAKYGMVDADGDGISMDETANNFAWQVGAGVGYALSDNMTLDVGYRYIDYGDVSKTIGNNIASIKMEADVTAHEFMLGARYKF